eukprot:178537_1
MSQATKAIQFAIQNASKLQLKCGRNLVYSEYGAPNGFPLIHFHGALSSRLEPLGFSDVASQRNIRIICADRPGAGLSDIDPNITYESFSNDTEQLISHLNITPGSFGFSGVSQGGTYVLSHLYYLKKLQPRIGALISTAGPYESNDIAQREIDAAIEGNEELMSGVKRRNYPTLTWARLKVLESVVKYTPQMLAKQMKSMTTSKADAAWFAKAENLEMFVEVLKYSLHKHGAKGWTEMSCNTFRNWGFSFKDIDTDTSKILCYHGADDTMCPIEWVQLIADKLDFKLQTFEEQGHLMMTNEAVISAIFDDIAQNLDVQLIASNA